MTKTKSQANESGKYTQPSMRKRLFKGILGHATHGTATAKCSVNKVQLVAKTYKVRGGGYK